MNGASLVTLKTGSPTSQDETGNRAARARQSAPSRESAAVPVKRRLRRGHMVRCGEERDFRARTS